MLRRLLPLFLCLASLTSAAGADLESTLRDHFARQAAGQRVRCVQLHGLRVTRTVAEGDSVSVDVETVATTWTSMPGSRPVTETQFATVTMRRLGEEWRVIATQRREDVLAERIAAATNDAQRSAIVEDAPELQTPALVDALCRRAVTRINQRDFETAQSLIGLAERIARHCRDDAARSFVLGARSVYARRSGEPLLGIELAAQSLAAAEESGNADAIARALLRVGRGYTELGSPRPDTFQRIMTLSDWIEDRSTVSLAASALAQYFDNQTDHRAALRFALRAAKEAEASGDRTALLTSLMNLGGVYNFQDDPELAAFHFERALTVSRELGFKASTASILGTLAEQYALTDDPVRRATANAFVAEGLDMIGCEDAATAAGLLWCRAQLAIDEGRYHDAEVDLQEAVRRVLSAPEGNTAPVLIQLAHLYLLQHRPEEALRVLEQAKVFADATNGYEIRIHAALALRALHRNEEAKDELEAACRLADDERSRISSDSRQLQYFFGNRSSAFRELVDLLVERGQTGAALAVAERMKGRALRDILASGGKDIEEAMTQAEQRERLALEQAIVQFNRAMTSTADNAAQHADVRAELGHARTALDEFNARIAALHGDAAQPTNDPDPVRLPPSLDGVTVLDFVIADQETTVFALYRTADGSTRLQATKITISQRALQSVVADFARRVAQRDLDYGVAARKLYDLLIRPVESAVLRNKTLCIVPDSILWKLPFAALLRPNGEHLAKRVAIFYAPSIALLTAPRPQRSLSHDGRGADLIAFANPAIDGARRRTFGDVYRSMALDPLPDAEKEVKALERLYGPERSRLYIGSAARESTLKEEAIHGRVLHFATHGVLDEVAPMFSALVLATGSHDAGEDGLLEAREVLRLPMQADLTILSACDTASGRLTPGEGIVGMTWAFLAAGCPTSVSSQWRAESSAAFRLMVELHLRLVRGVPTAAALRGAQLALQSDRRWSHPFYWAPFVVVGAGHDVALDPKNRRQRP